MSRISADQVKRANNLLRGEERCICGGLRGARIVAWLRGTWRPVELACDGNTWKLKEFG